MPTEPPEPPASAARAGDPDTKKGMRETCAQRNERIFHRLPPLGSPEYLELLETAAARDLPAEVLVRAYRQLGRGPAADATLVRLVANNNKYGYLDALYSAARRRVTSNDAYSVDDVIQNAIGDIVIKLGGKQGKGGETAWVSFCRQRLVDAHRELIGRYGERRPRMARGTTDPETGDELDPLEGPDVLVAPWHGNAEPDKVLPLRGFLRDAAQRIVQPHIREVALNLLSDNPLPVSSKDPDETRTLEHRLKGSRDQINRWLRSARAILRAAYESWKENQVDID